MKRRTRKSNNPFKMWGSWIGAVLINFIPLPFCMMGECGTIQLYKFWTGSLILGLIVTIIGFLVGWAIQGLIRKIFRRRK